MSVSGALMPSVSRENSETIPINPPTSCSDTNSPLLTLSQTQCSSSLKNVEKVPADKDKDETPSEETPLLNEESQLEISPTLPEKKENGDNVQQTVELNNKKDVPFNADNLATRELNSPFCDIYQDEGCGDGLATVESDDEVANTWTPPAVLWSRGLRYLLEDEVGHRVFQNYMERELGSAHDLYFWYACKGLRRGDYEGDIRDSIEVIWKHFIKNRNIKISDTAFNIIEDHIINRNFSASIFDQAQTEIENVMRDNVYRSFLESDDYLQCLGSIKREDIAANSQIQNFLPTLHEDHVLASSEQKHFPKLTLSNLMASLPYRVNQNKIKPEANAGLYLRDNLLYPNLNPYHINYVPGHTVSVRDSEAQSMSSGAVTDDTSSSIDTRSFMSLAQHGPSNKREQRRFNQRIREFAELNKESANSSALSRIHVVPRTMMPGNHLKTSALAAHDQKEFARLVSEKLHDYQTDQDRKIKLRQSLFKVTQGEETAAEATRKEHAAYSLPPEILKDRLIEEKNQLNELDPSQSILDDHVARVWDSPPISPKNGLDSGCRDSKPAADTSAAFRQMPRLAYPTTSQLPISQFEKCSLRGSRQWSGSNHQSFSSAVHEYPGLWRGPPTPLQGYEGVARASSRRSYHYQHQQARRRERDVNSTFSSDSGTVADLPEICGRLRSEVEAGRHLFQRDPVWQGAETNWASLSKSKSMPVDIENEIDGVENEISTIGSNYLSGLPHRAAGNSGRRANRKPHPDFTDSGVSVVSDSGRSATQSTTSERVESWLFQSRPSPYDEDSLFSVYPGDLGRGSVRTEVVARPRTLPRSTHTMAGSTSPGMHRRGGAGSSGRRSQCSSSTSAATTCVNTRTDASPAILTSASASARKTPAEMSPRDSPLGQAQPSFTGDAKIRNGANFSAKMEAFQKLAAGDVPHGSFGSTLGHFTPKNPDRGTDVPGWGAPLPAPPSQPATNSAPTTPAVQVTVVVYTFQDDNVPFIIKIPARPVCLKRLKAHLHKKGSFRYFFKKFCEEMSTAVFEEITEDSDILPLFDGKVFVQIHKEE